MTAPVGVLTKLKQPAEILKVILTWAALAAVFVWCQPSSATYWVGTACFLVGEVARVWAAGHLRRSSVLATDGPYAYVRDPLYLGRLLWVLGLGFYSGQPIVAAALIAVFLWYYTTKKVPKEMRRLERIFGDPYRDYRDNVFSLLPKLRPYPRRSGVRWQATTFLHNKEHWGLLVILAIVAAFGVKTFLQY